MTRTITAQFETLEQARQAAYELAQRVPGLRGEVYDAQTDGTALDALALLTEDAARLREGIRRGGGVVCAEVPDARLREAAAALAACGAIDVGRREARRHRDREGTIRSEETAPLPTGTADDPSKDAGRDI